MREMRALNIGMQGQFPEMQERETSAMMKQETLVQADAYRKLLREYSQYSINLKNWLYEDLTSIMGMSPPQWFFEIVYKDAHSPFIYWFREKYGLSENDQDDEGLLDLISRYGLIRDGPILRLGSKLDPRQIDALKSRLAGLNYEFVQSKDVFRPKWNGVKK